jgi:phospholipase/carboxylesterase
MDRSGLLPTSRLGRGVALAIGRRWIRVALLASLGLLLLLLLGALAHRGIDSLLRRSPVPITTAHQSGRLLSRPGRPTLQPPGPGMSPLHLTWFRDGALYVPKTLPAQGPVGLVLWLHGHGGSGPRSARHGIEDAERAGVLMVAPTSRYVTWDIVYRQRKFGADTALVDAALAYVFARFEIDPRRITIAGNSDGGTYALALGLGNGDLFSRIAAFVPEYIPEIARTGKPRVFLGHGRRDTMHRLEATSDVIARQLQAEGYPLRYEIFESGHLLPPEAFRSGLSGI